MTLLLVMLGAAAGAPSRWLVDRAVQRRNDSIFPWGTFTVNVAGSFLLGVIGAASASAGPWYALLGTGFCGGLTTFSAFSYETLGLIEDGSRSMAIRSIVGSLAVGMLAAFGGWQSGMALWDAEG